MTPTAHFHEDFHANDKQRGPDPARTPPVGGDLIPPIMGDMRMTVILKNHNVINASFRPCAGALVCFGKPADALDIKCNGMKLPHVSEGLPAEAVCCVEHRAFNPSCAALQPEGEPSDRTDFSPRPTHRSIPAIECLVSVRTRHRERHTQIDGRS